MAIGGDAPAALQELKIKAAGNTVFLLGTTTDELGGSHYNLVNTLPGGHVPKVDPAAALRLFTALHAAMQDRLIVSCHDLSEGGLAVAAAEMAFAGGLGLELSLQPLTERAAELSDGQLLFSESNSRFLLEVPDAAADRLHEVFADLPLTAIGNVTDGKELRITGRDGTVRLSSALPDLKSAWQSPLAWD